MFRPAKSVVSDERGQSLIVIVLAMTLIVALAAFAIDVAQWEVKHHQAQVTADAAALAAANYMSQDGNAGTATTTATTYASSNGIPIAASNVNVNTTAGTVTVTVPTDSRSAFAGLFGLGDPAISAKAVASFQAKVNYSIIADNPGCAAGDGITLAGNGGGAMDISGINSNGLFNDSNNSGTEILTGEYNSTCAAQDKFDKNALQDVSAAGTIAFTSTYNAPGTAGGPTCTSTASSFTDAQITSGTALSPNIYCATGACTGFAQGRASSLSGAGTIVLNHTVTNVELYADCVELDSGANGSTAPANQPLVYGAATGTNSTVIFAGNNITLTGTVYVPNSTVEFTFNNDIITFVEASNVVIDKNNGSSPNISGTGPLEIVPADTLTQ